MQAANACVVPIVDVRGKIRPSPDNSDMLFENVSPSTELHDRGWFCETYCPFSSEIASRSCGLGFSDGNEESSDWSYGVNSSDSSVGTILF